MAATDTGQTRVVPLQNVAYGMSQRINYLLTIKSPPKTELGEVHRAARSLGWICVNGVSFLSFFNQRRKRSIAEDDSGTPSLADINRSSRDTNALQLWARQTNVSGMAKEERRGEESRGLAV